MLRQSRVCTSWGQAAATSLSAGRAISSYGIWSSRPVRILFLPLHHLTKLNLNIILVRWRYHSSAAIERVVPHPTEEQLAVMERVPAPTTADAPTTKALVLSPYSSTPVSVRTLPFQLRSVVAVPSSGFFPTDPSGFTLVGITDAWSVVVFGDDVQLPEEEGASAQGITQDATIKKHTLFHDIFGASAFSDLATAPGPSTSVATSAQPWKGQDIAEIFDAPAHLMPPLELLFDTVMDGFLAERPEDDQPEADAGEDEEMDVDEVVEEADRPSKAAPLDRVVDRQEMGGFVQLFMQFAIKGSFVRHLLTHS